MTDELNAIGTENIFAGSGEMGALMQALDWSATPIGPVADWPQSLKTAVRIVLGSRYPMFVWWGHEMTNFYNDAYIPVLGKRHPQALGQPASLVWAEVWDTLGPQAEEVLYAGRASWNEKLLLIMERNGYPEETYFTFSYSPVANDRGGVGGVFCACTEDTRQVLSDRRLQTLRELAAKTAEAKTAEEACEFSAKILSNNPYDLPFTLLYLLDGNGEQAQLVSATGLAAGTPASPHEIKIGVTAAPGMWSLSSVIAEGKSKLVDNLLELFGPLLGSPWSESPSCAMVLPLTYPGQERQTGFLIAGISASREFDDDYRGFFDLVAGQVTTAITNARAYEEERQRAEALAELDRAKTAFFSNVSHELRTPLTLILGPTEDALADTDAPLPRSQRERTEVVQRNSLRLLKLVNTLLDFSRIEAGRIQAVYEPTDLAAFTAELASVFRSAIEGANMRLVVDCSLLPEPTYVDREMWEKIVLNLLSNAFKFTFAGEIVVRLQWMNDYVELKVQDTGTGIPAEEIPRLFERFHRVKGARGRSFEGSGIGLSLVQELVKLHGGTIQVTSVEGEGSCFTVSIPTGSAHLPQDCIGAARTRASTASGVASYVEEAWRWLPEEGNREQRTGNREESYLSPVTYDLSPSSARILLADDNTDMRDYVGRLLSQRYEVEAVADGAAALAAIRRHRPNLVLTDVMMPEVDGFELLRQLRADPQAREIPLILLSARAGEESRVEGLEAGADDYLIKPFSARELLARVEANLKMAQMRQLAAQREQGLRLETEAARDSLEAILSSISDVFVTLDRDWRYTYVNDRMVEISGMRKEDFLGRSIWEVFPDTVDSLFYTELHRAIAEQTPVHFEYFYLAWSRWFENRIYPSVKGVSIFTTEITARKQVEAEREQLLQREQAARAEAEAANRIKDEFLAVLSHELRSPLNPILGWTKLLQTRRFDEAKTTEALAIIERNVKLQTQLIEDLLDVSRILQGKMILNVCPVNLATTIKAALETVWLAAEAKDIQIQTVLVADVGQVSGDSSRLQQIVWNLLSNAIKFTPSGGRVEVRLLRVGTYAQIQVSDNGKGINPEFLPYVFEYFRQEDSKTTRKFGGLGLGLAIVRYLTELHGGTVKAASPGEGLGATFTVNLPLLKDESEGASSKEGTFSLDPHSFPLSQLRVLVVDDEADMRELVIVILEQYGAEVLVAASAAETLTVLDQFKPDVLISDIGMPDIDGYMLMRQVRSRTPEQNGQIPAIALTAYAGELDQQQALAAGFQMHIPKPVEPEELLKAIVNLLRRNHP